MREPGAEADTGAFQRSEGEVRLLPWTGIEGRPCHLVGDGRGGPISRLADTTEAIQLGWPRNSSPTPETYCRTPCPVNSDSWPPG